MSSPAMNQTAIAASLRSTPFPDIIADSKAEHEIKRALYQVSLLTDRLKPPFTIADLGAGMGLFPLACVEAGIEVYAVDDYRDPINFQIGDVAVNILRSRGVKIVEQDVFAPLPFAANSLDAITSFHSMEHWHKSPKSLFASCVNILKPGGVFLLAGPNCVNLRKRITVPLGRGKWSQMVDWYEQENFRGHVREPDVDDLRYIARDMGLENVKVYGRNWLGMKRASLTGAVSRLSDPILSMFPSLCSDIFMVGSKPNAR